jgi:transcription elongation factor GreB
MRVMSKAFTKESDADDEDEGGAAAPAALPAGSKNYMTPGGYRHMRAELMSLLDDERPKVVEVVSWAAKNGDRSENGDYLYGKKRLREIDRRIRFLTRRLELAEVVDPSVHRGRDQVFFGATVTYYSSVDASERTVTIKGVDESDSANGEISWISPMARALIKAKVGDEVPVSTPRGTDMVEVIEVRYPAPEPTDP